MVFMVFKSVVWQQVQFSTNPPVICLFTLTTFHLLPDHWHPCQSLCVFLGYLVICLLDVHFSETHT